MSLHQEVAEPEDGEGDVDIPVREVEEGGVVEEEPVSEVVPTKDNGEVCEVKDNRSLPTVEERKVVSATPVEKQRETSKPKMNNRPKRTTAGKHSNVHRLPQSVKVSSVVGLLRVLLKVLS